jgi:predicted DNA repair protein MutK
MSVGLIALLDDIAALAKAAAASLDDIAAQAAKAGTKAAGVVIDDAAVTPRYATGLSPARELPIIWKIALGSLRNKMLILLPAALALSLFLPQAITPLLMLGGLYLSYEGVEKIYHLISPDGAHAHESELAAGEEDEQALEDAKVAGAIRTDFILSAEIMAITLGSVPDAGIGTQAAVLALVGTLITIGVYGVVALIVKADDFGVMLAGNASRSPHGALLRQIGRGLVLGMPHFLVLLGGIGTAAMIWVGGGILLHGLESFGIDGPAHLVEQASHAAEQALPAISSLAGWLVGALGAGLTGLIAGAIAIPAVGLLIFPVWKRFAPRRA